MIGKLALALPMAKTTQQEARERVAIYWAALRDIPVDDLRFAFDRLIKTAAYFPTVKEIRAAAAFPMNMRAYRLMRMRLLLQRHEREWQPEQEQLSDEDRVEVQRFLANPFAGHAPPP